MEQNRAHRQSDGQRKDQDVPQPLQGGQEQAAQVATELHAANAAIDDILADYMPTEDTTEIISTEASANRPQLRDASSEEFVRAFRQTTGQ